MDYITNLEAKGNATDFGDLNEESDEGSGCSNSTRMLATSGGDNSRKF